MTALLENLNHAALIIFEGGLLYPPLIYSIIEDSIIHNTISDYRDIQVLVSL